MRITAPLIWLTVLTGTFTYGQKADAQKSMYTGPLVAVAKRTQVCEGQLIPLHVEWAVSSPNSVGTFVWSGPNGFKAEGRNVKGPVAGPKTTGIYSVTVTFTGTEGYTAMASTTVTMGVPRPEVWADSHNRRINLCSIHDLQLHAEPDRFQSSIPAKYYWSGPDGFFSNEQNPVVAANKKAPGVYALTVVYPNNCGVAQDSVIAVKPVPEVSVLAYSITNPHAIREVYCPGDTVMLRAVPALQSALVQYDWRGPNQFKGSGPVLKLPAVTPSRTGVYSLTATFDIPEGCGGVAQVNKVITVGSMSLEPYAIGTNGQAAKTFEAGTNIRLVANVQLPEGNEATYHWTGPSGFTSKEPLPVLTNCLPSQSGEYMLSVTSTGACSGVQSAKVYLVVKP